MKKLKIKEFQKEAAPVDWGNVRDHAIGAAVPALAIAGATALGTGVYRGGKHVAEPFLRNRRYSKLREEYPDLEDTPTARRAFRTLHKFSPAMASDPMSAHGFVNRVMNYNELTTPEQISTLVGVQRGMPQAPQAIDQVAQTFGRELGQSMRSSADERRKQERHDFDLRGEGGGALGRDATRRQEKHDFELGESGVGGSLRAEEKRRDRKDRRDQREDDRRSADSARKRTSHKWDKARAQREADKHQHQTRMDRRREQREIAEQKSQHSDRLRQRATELLRYGRGGIEDRKLRQGAEGNVLRSADTWDSLLQRQEQLPQRQLQRQKNLEEKGMAPLQATLEADTWARSEGRRVQKIMDKMPVKRAQLDLMRAGRQRSSAKAAFAEKFRR